MPTFDECCYCPRCGQKGRPGAKHAPATGRGVVHTIVCENAACRWYQTGWTVFVKPDGTIPERKAGPKQFQPMSLAEKQMAQRVIDRIKEEEERNARGKR